MWADALQPAGVLLVLSQITTVAAVISTLHGCAVPGRVGSLPRLVASLAGVAGRVQPAVDEHATVAPHGGDEFAVLLTHAGADRAEAAARAVREAFAGPLALSCGTVQAMGTVGVAVAEPGQSPDDVVAGADAAMYRAKPSGRRGRRA